MTIAILKTLPTLSIALAEGVNDRAPALGGACSVGVASVRGAVKISGGLYSEYL